MLRSQEALPFSNLKSGPGILRKVIKELVGSQDQSFTVEVPHLSPFSLPHSSPIILLCWGHNTSPQWPHASPVSRVVFTHSKHFILFNKHTKCPNRPTCPCMEGLQFPMIQILKLEWNYIELLSDYQGLADSLPFIRRQINSPELACYQMLTVTLTTTGGIEMLSIPGGSVCILSMQLPEYP